MQNIVQKISKFAIPSIALILALLMLKLGFWQLDRADFKAQKQSTIDTRIHQSERRLPAGPVDAGQWQYYRVKVEGDYLPELGFIVDNVVHNSVAGVNIVTPLRISDSDTLILVNRGWTEWGNDRTFLPIIDTPEGTVSITGVLVPAAEDIFYLKNPDEYGLAEQLWTQLDIQRFMKLTDSAVQPLILLLDGEQPGSYRHTWQFQADTWIARHKAYAFQWFGLAITLIVLMAVLAYNHITKKEKHE